MLSLTQNSLLLRKNFSTAERIRRGIHFIYPTNLICHLKELTCTPPPLPLIIDLQQQLSKVIIQLQCAIDKLVKKITSVSGGTN